LLSAAARAHSKTRREVRAHFERELSFEALGSKLATMYRDSLGRGRALEACARRDAALRASRG
jgi:hypothetical protein